VLITRWETQGEGGGALIHLLRDLRQGLRVLFIAGYSDGVADSGHMPEGSSILQKPFSGDSLGRKVRTLLDRQAETTP
jgi:FixJ family two-component response regulator